MNSPARAYRPEIDGLRAIAVLAVVIFHIERAALPKGYLGVDLFFVISGYLITGIIWREAQEGRYSIAAFYERRIRRIAPAMLVMVAVTTVFACLILLPVDLAGYAKSVLATITFVPNIYFWRDTDYFSRSAEEKPLLHMWSLGVEEQFYILFPLILVALARWRPATAPWVVAPLTLASLALAYGARAMGFGLPAFYLLPTRAWELGAGAVLALVPSITFPRQLGAPLSWLGLVLIGLGFFGTVIHLGELQLTLSLVFGTALMIATGSAGAGQFLGLSVPVFFGRISYSLYLWHWPIIVLVKYMLVRDLGGIEDIAIFGVMIAAGTISWRYCEQPFRSPASMPTRSLLLCTGIGAILCAASAVAIIKLHGLPGRLEPDVARINARVGKVYRCPVFQAILVGRSRGCILVLPSANAADADVAVIGNSHAEMYAPLITEYLRDRNLSGVLVMATGCIPSRSVNINVNCLGLADRYIADVIALKRAKLVVLALLWQPENVTLVDANGRVLKGNMEQAIAAGVDDTIKRLRSAGKQVVLVGPIATPGWDVASIASRSQAFHRPITMPLARSRADFMQQFGAIIEKYSADPDVTFVPAHQVQCDPPAGTHGRGEPAPCAYFIDGLPLFSDSNHLAVAALAGYRPLFYDALDRARNRK